MASPGGSEPPTPATPGLNNRLLQAWPIIALGQLAAGTTADPTTEGPGERTRPGGDLALLYSPARLGLLFAGIGSNGTSRLPSHEKRTMAKPAEGQQNGSFGV
jgi:hypothetical protein